MNIHKYINKHEWMKVLFQNWIDSANLRDERGTLSNNQKFLEQWMFGMYALLSFMEELIKKKKSSFSSSYFLLWILSAYAPVKLVKKKTFHKFSLL